MIQKNIESRADIYVLVTEFYNKIRKDDLLGPIFNQQIPEHGWASHLEKLTDFWETNLMSVRKFKGSPTRKHVEVDKNFNYQISQVHFGRWLQLWFQTIDALYVGELAFKAKENARKMSTGQFLMMWQSRPQEMKSL